MPGVRGRSMEHTEDPRYMLASLTQVREEGFGLLFYTMKGPHLYFLRSGQLLNRRFFKGEVTLDKWMQNGTQEGPVPKARILQLRKALEELREKGVIIEC